jgi:tRNA A-37 threonylcarbamoyl transferase component Bud32
MARPGRIRQNLMKALAVVAPLAWFFWLVLAAEGRAVSFTGRFPELVSWINVALMPLLGFLALAAYLATGNRQTFGLATAALVFAAVFPLHRLFDAQDNQLTIQYFGPPGRFLFMVCCFFLTGPAAPAPPSLRRRHVVILLITTALAAVIRLFFRDLLDAWAEAILYSDRVIEPLTIFLAVIAALRLFGQEYHPDQPNWPLLPWAFVATAEQTLFFLFSKPSNLLWLSANVVWGIATGLYIAAVFETLAHFGRWRAGSGDRSEASTAWAADAGLEIVGPLGEGGMGQVFKARHRLLRRTVAVKVIRREQAANPVGVHRFRREAQASARLSHPNIVEVYDAAEINGVHFLVMEYVEGNDLADLLQKHGRLPVSLACAYVHQTSLGLQHAHERGLVHRDIKPANLLVSADGARLKILDLGVARFQQVEEGDSVHADLTQTGAVMGTPAYLAPEQARDPRRVDIRADIYSLGCTFYHLLTGRAPFEGVSLAEVVLKHQLEEPAPVEHLRPEVPLEVQGVVCEMMAKRPDDRFQTPAQVAAALDSFAVLDPEDVKAWMAAVNVRTPSPEIAAPYGPACMIKNETHGRG